uniref:Uncharacterized protein n=1 Tax=Arundo donax TaxID=35708 RepID=A0A0A9B3M4_ARUDO
MRNIRSKSSSPRANI